MTPLRGTITFEDGARLGWMVNRVSSTAAMVVWDRLRGPVWSLIRFVVVLMKFRR